MGNERPLAVVAYPPPIGLTGISAPWSASDRSAPDAQVDSLGSDDWFCLIMREDRSGLALQPTYRAFPSAVALLPG